MLLPPSAEIGFILQLLFVVGLIVLPFISIGENRKKKKDEEKRKVEHIKEIERIQNMWRVDGGE
ncbi:MAG: hypothetical protein FWH17_10440 [Oscillospiraceae bacterium]|nr:hypothetical protein [Oscillospiraceae bacterium]